MDADIDEDRAEARTGTTERVARVEVRPPRLGGGSELCGSQAVPVALARERAEKVGMHG